MFSYHRMRSPAIENVLLLQNVCSYYTHTCRKRECVLLLYTYMQEKRKLRGCLDPMTAMLVTFKVGLREKERERDRETERERQREGDRKF